MASIVFAVILCVLMDALKKGFLDEMKKNMVGFYTGYVQVQQADYWDEKTLDNSFLFQDSLPQLIARNRSVTGITPRVESFTLAASEEYAKGAMIIGIDPLKEEMVTQLSEKIHQGSYLEATDKAVLIGEGLADYLKLGVGDTMVVLGQGYHGVSATAKYPIKGLIKFGTPDLNKGMIYLPLKESQQLFGMDNRLTSFVLQLKDIDKAEIVQTQIAADLSKEYRALHWKTMLPELDSFIDGETRENVVFQIVLYLLIAFGIFGTILMMTLERQREFGILVSVGMQKFRLTAMVILENSMIALFGALMGTLLSVPVVFYFNQFPIHVTGQLAKAYENFNLQPIFYFSLAPEIFYNQGLIVLAVAMVLSLYPIFKIARLQPVAAMRS